MHVSWVKKKKLIRFYGFMEKIFDFLDYVVYCGQQSVLPVKRGFVVFRVCFVIEAI